MQNPFYTYTYEIYMILFHWVYGISNLAGYLMTNLLYTYISNIYDLIWLVVFYGISAIVGYLVPNHNLT